MHSRQNSFLAIAVSHRPHRFGTELDASAPIPFVLTFFIVHLRSTTGRCSYVLRASSVKVSALALLSAPRLSRKTAPLRQGCWNSAGSFLRGTGLRRSSHHAS